MSTSVYSIGYENSTPLSAVTTTWVGGARPDWLRTTFIQNGPGLFSIGDERYHHWFDGLSMLRGFEIGDEIVARTAFLESPDYEKSTARGKVAYTEFATVPKRNLWERIVATLPQFAFGKNDSVNFQQVVDEVLAIGDLPGGIQIDPTTLATVGSRDLQQWSMLITTPHPQRDAKRKEWNNVGLGIGWKGVGYNVYALPDGQMRPRRIAFIPRRRPAYMHSVGASDSYVVVVEHPVLVSMVDMITLGIRNRPIIDAVSWDGDEPMTLFVVDKDSGELTARVEVPAKLYFHHANVFEQGDELVIDLCTYPDAAILDELYLDRLRSADGSITPATLIRYRIDLPSGRVSSDQLCDGSVEFPRVNPANLHRPYRYTYAVSYRPGEPTGQTNELIKVDVDTGDTVTWYEDGVYPTEPVMVPRPGATDEDDGVLLSVMLDVRSNRSALGVFDARSMTEIGRAIVPVALPFGFHGQVVPVVE